MGTETDAPLAETRPTTRLGMLPAPVVDRGIGVLSRPQRAGFLIVAR